MKKKTITRIIAMGLCIAMAVLGVVVEKPIQAQAAQNPLKDMPSKETYIEGCQDGIGCDFYTPSYSQKFTMTAKSSNKKVATVKVDNFKEDGKYFKGYEIDTKGYGTTKITVTVKLGGKTYKKTCKFTYSKYTNPFSSFNIGSNDLSEKLNENYFLTVNEGELSGTLSYKLKSGYKISDIIAHTPDTDKTLKNGKKLPKNINSLYVTVYDKKLKAYVSIGIEAGNNE